MITTSHTDCHFYRADTGTDHFIDADKMVVARNDTDLKVDEKRYS